MNKRKLQCKVNDKSSVFNVVHTPEKRSFTAGLRGSPRSALENRPKFNPGYVQIVHLLTQYIVFATYCRTLTKGKKQTADVKFWTQAAMHDGPSEPMQSTSCPRDVFLSPLCSE